MLVHPMSYPAIRACLAVTVLAAGCAGELEQPERFAECPDGYVEFIFHEVCGGACHGDQLPEAGLDLSSNGVAVRVLGTPSQTGGPCAGKLLVDPDAPDDPSAHLLLDKLLEEPSCGAPMPPEGDLLNRDQRECVRRWIVEAIESEAR